MIEHFAARYARLIVRTGVNLQPGQTLVINAPLEGAPFARLIAEAAYEAGAREAVMNWNDELSAKIRYLKAPAEVFDEFPAWRKEFYLSYARSGAAFVTIAAADPELLRDASPDRMAAAQKASALALREYRERLMANRNAWCVASIPTAAWAQKVFPALPPGEATAKLWRFILQAVRADRDDPAAAWEAHTRALAERLRFLNEKRFRRLHFVNSLGTDLTIDLPDGHIWQGGAEHTADGVPFVANMPTEEVFTAPKRDGVNGRAVGAKPLHYQGNLIENFSFVFAEGRIVEYQAGKGREILGRLLQTDDGSRYLGEVALVPYDSPVSNQRILYYNTLFDENAACHLAIGKAYPNCVKGGGRLSGEELLRRGVNDSLAHEDFMIGTADLTITGLEPDGAATMIFKNGNFAISR